MGGPITHPLYPCHTHIESVSYQVESPIAHPRSNHLQRTYELKCNMFSTYAQLSRQAVSNFVQKIPKESHCNANYAKCVTYEGHWTAQCISTQNIRALEWEGQSHAHSARLPTQLLDAGNAPSSAKFSASTRRCTSSSARGCSGCEEGAAAA